MNGSPAQVPVQRGSRETQRTTMRLPSPKGEEWMPDEQTDKRAGGRG
jgi:hypothetical protein